MKWNEESFITGGWGECDSGLELPSDITEPLGDWVDRTTSKERVMALEHLKKIRSVSEPLPIVVENNEPYKLNEKEDKLDLRLLLI